MSDIFIITEDGKLIRLISFEQAKEFLHIGQDKLYRHLNQNSLTRLKVGKNTFIREDELITLKKSERMKRHDKKTPKKNKNLSNRPGSKIS